MQRYNILIAVLEYIVRNFIIFFSENVAAVAVLQFLRSYSHTLKYYYIYIYIYIYINIELFFDFRIPCFLTATLQQCSAELA